LGKEAYERLAALQAKIEFTINYSQPNSKGIRPLPRTP